MLHLIIGVIAGALAGNLPGRFAAALDIGWLGNTITGALGGLIGQRALAAGVLDAGDGDLTSLFAAVATGAVGGGVLAALAGVIRNRGAG